MIVRTHLSDGSGNGDLCPCCARCGRWLPAFLDGGKERFAVLGERVGVIQSIHTAHSAYLITTGHDSNKPCVEAS